MNGYLIRKITQMVRYWIPFKETPLKDKIYTCIELNLLALKCWYQNKFKGSNNTVYYSLASFDYWPNTPVESYIFPRKRKIYHNGHINIKGVFDSDV